MTTLFDNLSSLLNIGGNLALTEQGISSAREAGQSTQNTLSALAEQVRQGTQFKPYTVTSGLGTTTATAGGSTSTLSPEMEAIRQQLLGGGMGMLGKANQPIDQSAASITAALEAASAPSREREMLALEQRLFNQGRLGVSTAQYGGTPEQLALAKAIEEQRAMNAITGRQQALTEQAQNYNLGAGAFGLSFAPIQQQLQQAQVATPFAELATRLGLQGVVTGAELEGTGAQSRLQGEQIANALRASMLSGLLNTFTAPTAGGSSILSGLLSGLFNKDPAAPAPANINV